MNTSTSHDAPKEASGVHPLYPEHEQQAVNLPLPEDMPREKPFRVELFRTDERGGKFTPASRLIVTRALRTSGLLHALPDAEAKTLLLLMTYLRPDGRCEVSVQEVATVLDAAPAKARSRLDRLAALLFGNQPVVHVMRRSNPGLDSYVLSSALIDEQQAPTETDKPEATAPLPAYRDEIIAHSRSLYAGPRAEVEALILTQQLGHASVAPPDTSTPEGAARQAMMDVGIPHDQINLLLASFPIENITKQVAWLPHRHPKDPAKLLASAIRHDYEPPAFIRLQEAIKAEEADSPTDTAIEPPQSQAVRGE